MSSSSQQSKTNNDQYSPIEKVDYDALDKAKLAFIAASKKTLTFAQDFGFVPEEKLGASANLFSLNLEQYLNHSQKNIYITLISEGLGTADDARPPDLTAEELQQFWYNIAIKTISSLTNDAASAGLQTILISLYLPSSDPKKVFDTSFIDGFTTGLIHACKTVGCVWISGETPQLKGKIYEDKLDIAGSLFALSPAGTAVIDGSKLQAGNKIVLIGSSGPHENGFTTLRALADKLPNGYRSQLPNGQEFWQAINAPSKLYTPLVQNLLKEQVEISNLENITGHGWLKLMRSTKNLCYHIKNVLPLPAIFPFVQEHALMTKEEMLKTFNCGAGFAIFLPDETNSKKTINIARQLGYEAIDAGEVLTSQTGRQLIVEPFNVELNDEQFLLKKS
jgi:phosphoribosylformylglycinamidine cyclo-ligase